MTTKEFQLDDCRIKVKVKGDKTEVQAAQGFNENVKTIMSIQNNGNGYYVKTKSYSSIKPDHVFNLDYAEIEYLYYAYKVIKDSWNKNAGE